MKLPLWRRRQDRELDEELRSHLQMAIADRVERGEPPEAAAAAARREFGNELLVKETVREMWGWTAIEQFWHDLGHARRALMKAPAFTIAAVLTLGLGIGANVAMFSVVRAVMLRPLPFPDPGRLVQIDELDLRGGGDRRASVSWPNFRDWQQRGRTFESLAAYHESNFTVTGVGAAQHVPGAVVSATFLDTLGVQPAVGRGFSEGDERVGVNVAIISDELRRAQLGSRNDLVGSALTIDGRPFTIVGIMPRGFVFPIVSPPPQLWVTAAEDARVESPDDTPMTEQRGAHYIKVVGRLRRDVRIAEAQAEIEGVAAVLARDYPDDNANRSAAVTPQLDALIGETRRPLLLLLGAVACVLLIACVNLANLMTARGIRRQPELALRVALGGSRGRMIRLLVAEAAALAALAAVCGVGFAWWSRRLLIQLAPSDIRGLDQVAIDGAVLGYTTAVAAMCALLVGLVPAFRATRGDLRHNLGASRTATGARSQSRWLNGLIVTETAAGVVLLVVATLVIGGLGRLARTDPGFDASQVTTLRVSLPDSRYPYREQVAFYDRLLPELARIPGVQGAAIVGPLPLSGSRYGISFELPGDRGADAASRPSAGFAFVSPGYFAAMRIPIVEGREFAAGDTDAGPRVVVVNESFARRYFPNLNPIGQRIKPGLSTTEPQAPWREIVGVAADVKQVTLRDSPDPMYFVPHAQGIISTPHIVIRSAAAESVPESARRVIAAADPELAVYDVRTLQERLTATFATQRFATWLLALFAGLGLVLTGVGVYGVLAYTVSQRVHEFGVRSALGATARQIAGAAMSTAVRMVGVGLLVGIALSSALGQVMQSALDFVDRPDLDTFIIVALILLVVSGAAILAPILRAIRVDPMQTLRSN
jgi:putative ABC transport system permease protein